MEEGGVAGASVDGVDQLDRVSSVEVQKEMPLGAKDIVGKIMEDVVVGAVKDAVEERVKEEVIKEAKENKDESKDESKNENSGKKEKVTPKSSSATQFFFQDKINQTIEELKNIDENIKSLTETISRAVIITTVSCFSFDFSFIFLKRENIYLCLAPFFPV